VAACPYDAKLAAVPSFATKRAAVADTRSQFPIDYSIDPQSIPLISAADVLNDAYR
jgi:hypothetical protein